MIYPISVEGSVSLSAVASLRAQPLLLNLHGELRQLGIGPTFSSDGSLVFTRIASGRKRDIFAHVSRGAFRIDRPALSLRYTLHLTEAAVLSVALAIAFAVIAVASGQPPFLSLTVIGVFLFVVLVTACEIAKARVRDWLSAIVEASERSRGA